MAVSTSFSGAKLEALFFNCCSSTSSYVTTTHLSFFGRNRMSFVQSQRGSIRCEASSSSSSSDVLVDSSNKNSTTVSALQQLKTSAADSKSSFKIF